MDVIVSNGSYEYNLKKRFVRLIITDQNGYLWLVNSGGKLRFPSYAVNDNDDLLDKAVTCFYNFFSFYNRMEFYGTFSYYNLLCKKDEFGKKYSKNDLSVNECYIVEIDDCNPSYYKKHENFLVKETYENFMKKILSSKDYSYREEMLTIVRFLPEDIKNKAYKESEKIKKIGSVK